MNVGNEDNFEVDEGSMTLKDLIESGKLKVGQKLVWNRRNGFFECYVTEDGKLKFPDGTEFKTPSGAAKYVNGGKNIDGWIVWKIAQSEKDKSDINLSELRLN